jgi:hypothetical protein
MYVETGTAVPAQAFPGESAWKLRINVFEQVSGSAEFCGRQTVLRNVVATKAAASRGSRGNTLHCVYR